MSKQYNYKQVYAIKQKNKERVLKVCPSMKEQSGIYFLTRTDENNINYFYIGQSVNCLDRMCSHLTGYQHIDLSLKKRGFYTTDNPFGWKLNVIYYPQSKLDKMEKHWILEYTKKGYQCRYNKTAGGQGEGKEQINEYRPHKGYRDGIKQGKKDLAKELCHIAKTHLEIDLKADKKHNRISEQALEKFWYLLDAENYE